MRYCVLLQSDPNYLYRNASTEFSLPIIDKFIAKTKQHVQTSLPKIPADLLLGMTIGVDSIKEDTDFYQDLITTGLVHVVVVSGYNVSLVMGFIDGLFKEKLRARNSVVLAVFLSLYVLLCGAQAPVVRAAVMGYVAYMAKRAGRGLDGMLLLVVVCMLMLFVQPRYIVSLSFWLSTLATLGLMLFESLVKSLITSVFKPIPHLLKILPLDGLCSSLACQITVWPVISYFFWAFELA